MSKPYDVGVICGRFQTFHIGHESLVDTALKLCDRVLILVGSSQECGTERNPLNIDTRIRMLRAIYGDDGSIIIKGISDLTNENDIRPEWGRYLLDNIDRYIYKTPELMIYGNDESRSRWFDPDDIKDVTEIIVSRGKIPISATQVRALMVADNRKEWQKWVNPKLHKMYDEIRRELMSVPFYASEEYIESIKEVM
ncbi:adenylyltransferase/cytidyltransferase family protein [Ruminococcus sp.]|uniref:adenylyltransferase/cytidyltransferase family protein n=1 Tax=Ruminococcus sp. TaxID=41978 RepID=UPI0025DDF60F|nr:adenylyltransferase/cytidyltransferase family protein [Ruminococcus sp.]